jgi:hypothetical protein
MHAPGMVCTVQWRKVGWRTWKCGMKLQRLGDLQKFYSRWRNHSVGGFVGRKGVHMNRNGNGVHGKHFRTAPRVQRPEAFRYLLDLKIGGSPIYILEAGYFCEYFVEQASTTWVVSFYLGQGKGPCGLLATTPSCEILPRVPYLLEYSLYNLLLGT